MLCITRNPFQQGHLLIQSWTIHIFRLRDKFRNGSLWCLLDPGSGTPENHGYLPSKSIKRHEKSTEQHPSPVLLKCFPKSSLSSSSEPARASTEAPGAGIIGALVTQVQTQSKQTVSTVAVDYPATLTNYASSSAQGTQATITLLTNQAQTCPSQKIVLVGYSQGAHIIGDAVAGGGGVAGLGAATPPVPASISNRVNAIIQMGDPRHVPGQSFDRGTAVLPGLFPRQANQQYSATLQPRILSFCDFNDPFCASGVDVNVHLTYLDRDQNTAAQFILQQIGG